MRTPPRFRTAAATTVVLVAAVVAVVSIGFDLAAASPSASLAGSPTAAEATITPTAAPLDSGSPSSPPSVSAAPTDSLPPASTDSPAPSATPTRTPGAGPVVATRVVVPDLKIDLAVTSSPPANRYPYCNVAMYIGKPFGQPGQSRATYLFAHARIGMFYPIYDLTIVKRTPKKMVGMLVDVYTSDSMVHVYRVTEVLAHQLTIARALAVTHDELWLQTSEGPHGTPGKTQVVAEPVSTSPASFAASHPKVHIVRCGY
jgi:hypothetical protein